MIKINFTRTAIAATGVSSVVLPTKTYRKAYTFYNNCNGPAYLAMGSGASTRDFSVIVPASGYYESPENYFNGDISVVWDNGTTGSGMFTELY